MNYKMIDNKTEQESEKHDNLDLILKIKKLEKEIKKIKIKVTPSSIFKSVI